VGRLVIAGSVVALVGIAFVALAEQGKDTAKATLARKRLQTKVTVDYDNTPLREVVEDLNGQVEGLGLRIDAAGGVSSNRPIAYKAEKKPLEEVLAGMFEKIGLGYVVVSKEGTAYDGTILIRQGKERGYPVGEEPASPAARGKGDKEAAKGKSDADDDKPAAKGKGKSSSKKRTSDKSSDKPRATPAEPQEDSADKAETDAAHKLKFAKILADDGKVVKARERLNDIIAKYPKTKAADEARELLKKLEQ
jgi:hypothetical protein